MKHIISYGIVFLLGILLSFYYIKNTKSIGGSEQVTIIKNGIKNVSKLVVTEASYSEVYRYQDVDTYFFESFGFEKKLTLLVNATVQVSYDLRELDIELDSLNKKLIIKNIPDEIVTIMPDIKYYDFQQSIFNSFTKNDLNEKQQKAIDKLLETIEISDSKTKAKERLLVELKQLLSLTEIVGWTIEDQTEDSFLKDISFRLKD